MVNFFVYGNNHFHQGPFKAVWTNAVCSFPYFLSYGAHKGSRTLLGSFRDCHITALSYGRTWSERWESHPHKPAWKAGALLIDHSRISKKVDSVRRAGLEPATPSSRPGRIPFPHPLTQSTMDSVSPERLELSIPWSQTKCHSH